MKNLLLFTLLFLITQLTFSQWTQQGADIDGEAAGDNAGFSVSLSADGTVVAIGVPINDGNGSASGHVRVYQWDGATWNQIGNDIDGETSGNYSGRSVSLSSDGSIVAIGAADNDGNTGNFNDNRGHARIYQYDGLNWNQLGSDIDGEAAGDRFGSGVSLSSDGSIVAIGGTWNDDNGVDSGYVQIYQFDGVNWNQLGNDIDGETAGDQSGWSVSLSSNGSRVAIGAYSNDGNTGDPNDARGHVRIYEFDGVNWNQLGSDIDGETDSDNSGYSVSLNNDGNRVAIGAQKNDGNGNNSGHVRIYEFDGVNWNQVGSDINGEASGDRSGWSVSLNNDGSIVAIGARLNDGNGNLSGHVRVYQYDGVTWNQVGFDIDGEASNDYSGSSVSLSSDGSRVAIGAFWNDGNGSQSGHVRIFTNPSLLNLYTAIPDANFEQALIDQDIDSEAILDGQVLTADISGLTTLDVGVLGIADLTGIEDFTALQELSCYNNLLTTLDVSNNTNLTALYCDSNQLSSLDVSTNTNLITLWVQYNPLTSLAVNGATNLQELLCAGNQLSTLDVTGATSLQTLYAPDNQLTAVEVGTTATLTGLYCNNNQLTALDLSGASGLTTLWAYNNPTLSCIQVDNEENANAGAGIYTNWSKDVATSYSESCIPDPVANLWTQVGSDIDGEAAGDNAGFSVSLSADGTVVAIGALYNDANGVESGHVRVYQWNGVGWTQLGQDIDGEAGNDLFGYSVSLSDDGSIVAIGAPLNDGNGNTSGHVRIFELQGGNWVQLGIDIDGEATGDNSGVSVSLSNDGSRVAIGAASNDGNGVNSGHVRIFELQGGNWVQLGIDIDGEATGDNSGVSVSLNGDGSRVAIGAYFNDANGANSGHVRIFELQGGNWVQQDGDIDGEAAGDHFGYSVSQSNNGNRVAIGARSNDGNGVNSGHVRIFELQGGNWVQLGIDIDGEASGDYSGNSVSLSSDGTRVAIGAQGNGGGGPGSGHVRIYEFDGVDWGQLDEDIDGETAGDLSGEFVSLSGDGSRVAIGARGNDGNGLDSGHVRVFTDSSLLNSYTAIPDADFEQALIDQGIDSEAILDGQVLTADISGLTTLDVGVSGIADLTGIEDFTALQELSCYNNLLTTLDVSNNTNLTALYCDSNQLSSLDVSTNTSLTTLWVQYNPLTDLTVNGATNLQELLCAGNQLSTLDVTGATSLQTLYAPDNQLTAVEVGTTATLTGLYCNNNQLTALDLSGASGLTTLWAYDNPTLSCIEVTNEADATAGAEIYTLWQKDITTIYSEDCSLLLSGIYTIGGLNPDFLSFAEAVTALHDYGVQSPVIFEVRDGTYNEQLSTNEISGVSAINTITFRSESGDPTAVTLSYPGASPHSYVWRLNGTDYLALEQITFENTIATRSRAIYLAAEATHNTFTGNVFVGESTDPTGTYHALIYDPDENNHSNTFTDNLFLDGSYGIYSVGAAGNLITGTIISGNEFDGQFQRGIFARYQDGLQISDNNLISTSTYDNYRGFYLQYCTNGLEVSGNRLDTQFGRMGISINDSDGTPATPGLIYNNFVHVGQGSQNVYGIRLYNSTYLSVYFNSVNITHNDGGGIIGRAYRDEQCDQLVLSNNILYNQGGGQALSHYQGSLVSDYNNLYVTGSNLGWWNGDVIADLAELQASYGDLNSISVDPVFVSNTDLHASAAALQGAATPILDITTDIDGGIRDAVNPDIGADEIGEIMAKFIDSNIKGEETPETETFGQEIHIYPNPVGEGDLNIDLGEVPEAMQYTFILADLSGKVLASKTQFVPKGRSIVTLNTAVLKSKGVYILLVKTQSKTLRFRVIK